MVAKEARRSIEWRVSAWREAAASRPVRVSATLCTRLYRLVQRRVASMVLRIRVGAVPHQRGDRPNDALRVVVEVEARDGAVQRKELALRPRRQVDLPPPLPAGAAAGEQLLEASNVPPERGVEHSEAARGGGVLC